MKRLIALLLAICLCCGIFAGCSQKEAKAPEEVKSNETEQTEKEDDQVVVEDDGVLKILMIGQSLGMDSVFMLPDVFKNENAGPVVVGILYHSGCRLGQHVEYLTNNAPQYAYFEYNTEEHDQWYRADCNGEFFPYIPNTANDTYISDGSIAQTMEFGVTRHDWDIVVTQAGVFEAANAADSAYDIELASDIQTIIGYVLEKDIQPASKPQIAWNITWTCPSDDMLNDTYNTYLHDNFADADAMYAEIVKVAETEIAEAYDFDMVFPAGTALQNARSSVFTPKELYRDTIHASDFGRLIVAYTWYCTLTGADINTCQFAPMNTKILTTDVLRLQNLPFEMTEQQKTVLIESVANALATPYAMTQSVNVG